MEVVEAVVGVGGEVRILGVGVIWQMRRFPQSDSMERVGVVSYGSRSVGLTSNSEPLSGVVAYDDVVLS